MRRGAKRNNTADAGGKVGQGERKEFGRDGAEMQSFEVLPQKERVQEGEQRREWEGGGPALDKGGDKRGRCPGLKSL